jgi:uncharacterized UBP type Zn finger protein
MCSHLSNFTRPRREPVTPSAHGCRECLERGDSWVHLRLCMTCGHVGCCDDSPNRHATKHFHRTKHPVIKSYEPGEDWAWCYVDDEMLESAAWFPIESPPEHYTAPGEGR